MSSNKAFQNSLVVQSIFQNLTASDVFKYSCLNKVAQRISKAPLSFSEKFWLEIDEDEDGKVIQNVWAYDNGENLNPQGFEISDATLSAMAHLIWQVHVSLALCDQELIQLFDRHTFPKVTVTWFESEEDQNLTNYGPIFNSVKHSNGTVHFEDFANEFPIEIVFQATKISLMGTSLDLGIFKPAQFPNAHIIELISFDDTPFSLEFLNDFRQIEILVIGGSHLCKLPETAEHIMSLVFHKLEEEDLNMHDVVRNITSLCEFPNLEKILGWEEVNPTDFGLNPAVTSHIEESD